MKQSVRTGFGFGLTSGVITTLGLMVGLHSGTHSPVAVAGGILTIAVADAMSDALGIHIAEEGRPGHSAGEVWVATAVTFAAKFGIALTFLVPVMLFELQAAIGVSIVWGLAVLAVLSHRLARRQEAPPAKVIFEHLAIAVVVVGVSHGVGDLAARIFAAPG